VEGEVYQKVAEQWLQLHFVRSDKYKEKYVVVVAFTLEDCGRRSISKCGRRSISKSSGAVVTSTLWQNKEKAVRSMATSKGQWL
jgi:hypothetical protein